MSHLYKPNEFYSMLGITRETLRHYVEKGLVSPAVVNEKGYAFYSDREVLQLMAIRYYRSYDLPVDDVRKFFTEMTVDDQLGRLDGALAQLERQIESLRYKKRLLTRRRELLQASTEELDRVFLDETGREMRVLCLEDALRNDPGGAVQDIGAMAGAYPLCHIALIGSLEDFLARRGVRVKLGFGCTEQDMPYLKGDISRFRLLPRAKCIVVRVRTHDPLCIPPEDLSALYREIESNGYRVVDGVFGHLLSMEDLHGRCQYYITMRVHIE